MIRALPHPHALGGLLVAVAATGPLLLVAPVASAAPAAPAVAAAAVASLRVAHLSPGTPAVDVTLSSLSGGSTDLGSAEAYGETSPYRAVPPGVYTVVARPSGSQPSSQPLLAWTVEAKPGEAYTVAAVGTGPSTRGVVLRDDLTPPAPGKGSVRFIQAAGSAAQATLTTVGGAVVASPTAFASATGYAQVPAGTWPLTATAVGQPTLRAEQSVSVPSGTVVSVVLLDQPGGGLVLRSVADAAGTAVAPRAGVDTGGGGTAVRDGGTAGPELAGAPAAGALGAVATGLVARLLVRRRRRPERLSHRRPGAVA